jgi:tetratricopeptide (TPR) repeat protein
MANATLAQTGQSADHLTQVRRLLRLREYRRAIELIDRNLGFVDGAPVPIEDLRTYAYELLVQDRGSPVRRPPVNLRRGIPVSLRRPVTVDLRRLTRSQLERLLRWLLAAEIRAADDALRADDYADAVASAEQGERIDNRCTHLSMVHARALYELAVLVMKSQAPNLDDAAAKLERAGWLAMRAAADPSARDAHKKLSVAIDDVTAIIHRRRARTAQADAVNAVVQRFNRLVRHYSDADQLISHVQVGNARSSLARIRADAEQLLRQHPAESPAGRILIDLRGQCARYKEHLERVGRKIRFD